MTPHLPFNSLTRREMLRRIGGGFGALGLASTLAAESASPLTTRPSQFPARAKRVIYLFMNGGPSHVDTFDPKPGLEKFDGKDAPSEKTRDRVKGKLMRSPFKFAKFGRSGIEVSELFPEIARHVDDICV